MSLNHHVPIFKRTPTGLGGVHVGSQIPPSSCDITCFGSCDTAFWTTGTFLNGSPCVCLHTLQILRICDRGQCPPSHSDLFLPGRNVGFFSALIQTGVFFFSRFPWSEINLSITHECKGYLSNDLKERVLHCCFHKFLSVRLQRYLKKCNVCFFWLDEEFKSQGKLFSLEDNKNDLDGNELTQHHRLVWLLLSWCVCLHQC